MPSTDFAVAKLLWELLNHKTGELGRVDFLPQKPAFDFEHPIEQSFPRSTPEEQGVDSSYLSDFVKELAAQESIHMHQLMILRHGTVIYEGGFDPYRAGVWHATYSMCKSFTNMAVGLLVDDGKLRLEDRAVDILQEEWENAHAPILSLLRYREITVRNLLTMSTGVAFNEAGAVSGNDWIRNYFESGVKFQPGTAFEYNSMNSMVLSAIVTKLTGKTMFDFLKERLFEPMGIRKVFWETSPKGLTKGGWGMFITEEDAAKLGTLYLNKGVWKGQQLISRKWVEESTSPQIDTGEQDNPKYGYHIWMDCRPGSFCYNGMLGQNLHCFPDIDVIVITNAGNEEVFQTGNMTKILRRYFGPDYQPSGEMLPENITAYRRLMLQKKRLEGGAEPCCRIVRGGWGRTAPGRRDEILPDRLLSHLNGQTFHMSDSGIGLFPLIMQVIHNNYTNGISDLGFSWERGLLTLQFHEGAQTHCIPVGLERGRTADINMNGEDYLVGTLGRFSRNEDGVPVLILRIAFIEEATERRLKIFFRDPDHLELHWSETPGDVIITNTLEQITLGSGNANPLVEGIFNRVSPDLFSKTMQSAIQPVVIARRK